MKFTFFSLRLITVQSAYGSTESVTLTVLPINGCDNTNSDRFDKSKFTASTEKS